MSNRISLDHVRKAQGVIDPVFQNSPQYNCERLSDLLNIDLTLKIETLNPIRSFKGRGADFFLSRHDKEPRLMCASAGNFGQAMAYACRIKIFSKQTYFRPQGLHAFYFIRICMGGCVDH